MQEFAFQVEAFQDRSANRGSSGEHAGDDCPFIQRRLVALDRIERAGPIVAAKRVQEAFSFDDLMCRSSRVHRIDRFPKEFQE